MTQTHPSNATKPITLICTLKPQRGKFDRVKSLLVTLATNVQRYEGSGCLVYRVFEQTGRDRGGEMVLVEKWRSKEDLENHHGREYLKDTHKKMEEEALLVGKENIRVVEEVWGFGGE